MPIIQSAYLQIYILKFLGNSRINTQRIFSVIHRHAKWQKILVNSTPTFPAEVEQGNTMPSYFSYLFLYGSPTLNECPFHGLFSAMFSHFLCFVLGILLLKWFPNVVLKC